MAITMKLLMQSAPFGQSWCGRRNILAPPDTAGVILRAKSKVLDIEPSRSKPDRAIVLVECLTFNQDEELRNSWQSCGRSKRRIK
jgi:acyl dehydratase